MSELRLFLLGLAAVFALLDLGTVRGFRRLRGFRPSFPSSSGRRRGLGLSGICGTPSEKGVFGGGWVSLDSWTPGLKCPFHRHPTGPLPSGLLWTQVHLSDLSAPPHRPLRRAAGRGRGPARSVGEMRRLMSPSSRQSSMVRTPPHLPVASPRVPSSPPLRGGEDV
jgi:hypothetical protein